MISKYYLFTFWPFLKQKYNFDDKQIKPYNFSLQPFLEDKSSIQQGYVTSEPYSIKKQAGFDPVIGKKKSKPTPLGRYRTRVNWRQKDGE